MIWEANDKGQMPSKPPKQLEEPMYHVWPWYPGKSVPKPGDPYFTSPGYKGGKTAGILLSQHAIHLL